MQSASFQKYKTPSPNEYPGYDAKPSDDKYSTLDLREMWSMLSLPLPLGPLWPRVVAPDKVPSMAQIEMFDIETACKQMNGV